MNGQHRADKEPTIWGLWLLVGLGLVGWVVLLLWLVL